MGWQPAAIFLHLDDAALAAIAGMVAAIVGIIIIPPFIAARLAARARLKNFTGDEDEWVELLAITSWTLWIALERYLDLQGILHEAGLGVFPSFAFAWLLPGTAAVTGCWAAWHPELARQREATVSLRRYLCQQTERFAGVFYAPVMLSFTGYPIAEERIPAYLVFTCCAGVIAVTLGRMTDRTLLAPQPLTSGDLYQRALHLAGRAKVKLKAVRVVSLHPCDVPNAYAMWGGKIGISAEYVRDLPPDQLDATLVHELAHVRYYDLLRPLLAGIFYVALVHPLLAWLLAPVVHPAWNVMPQSAVLLFGLTLVLRRSEYRADALAADLVSPEAEVRSLFAIHRLGNAPLTQHPLLEAASAHPSLLNRVRAVARRHGQSADWLRTILLEEWREPLDRELRALAAIHPPAGARTPSLS
jgi:Zn-dependent protease with chaperone function